MQCAGGFKTVYVGNAKIINFPKAKNWLKEVLKGWTSWSCKTSRKYLGTLHQWNRRIMTGTAPSVFQCTTLWGEVSRMGLEVTYKTQGSGNEEWNVEKSPAAFIE